MWEDFPDDSPPDRSPFPTNYPPQEPRSEIWKWVRRMMFYRHYYRCAKVHRDLQDRSEQLVGMRLQSMPRWHYNFCVYFEESKYAMSVSFPIDWRGDDKRYVETALKLKSEKEGAEETICNEDLGYGDVNSFVSVDELITELVRVKKLVTSTRKRWVVQKVNSKVIITSKPCW